MKLCFESLGCDKNLVDSEVMLGLLKKDGFTFTDEEADADIIVVNTCCFIHDAKQESINTLLSAAGYKKTGHLKALIAAGCLAERYADQIRKEMPEVDAVVGTTAYEKIVPVIREVLQKQEEQAQEPHVVCLDDLQALPLPEVDRVNTTGGYTTYLKIAEGCDKHCTYCIIPKVRGDYRSVPMEHLLKEAAFLAEGGAKELILVAQETTVYGTDIYGVKKLPELLHGLCKIPGIKWIRILYCYPEEITEELIDTIRDEPKICHYLDMPIQHCADGLLKRMGRRTDEQELRDVISRLRTRIPDIALRTTLITGFPGETEEDQKKLAAFVSEERFDRLGVFTYSKEEGTPAAKMKEQIPERVKKARRNEIMALQQTISAENGRKRIGEVLDVLIEGSLPEDNIYLGRSYRDAPGVDGYVFVESEQPLLSGDMVRVEITAAKEYDLIGRQVE